MKMPGRRVGLGSAANMVNARAVLRAVLLSRNHGGFTVKPSSGWPSERWKGRKGARVTDFCERSNISVLCTTPVPDWMSVAVFPG